MSEDEQKQDAERRDNLLLRLLKAPPQPRPKRERGNQKPKTPVSPKAEDARR